MVILDKGKDIIVLCGSPEYKELERLVLVEELERLVLVARRYISRLSRSENAKCLKIVKAYNKQSENFIDSEWCEYDDRRLASLIRKLREFWPGIKTWKKRNSERFALALSSLEFRLSKSH